MNTDLKNPLTKTQQQAGQADQQDVQAQQSVVSVPVGGAEGAPARVEKSSQSVEDYLKPSEVEPQISPEVAQYVAPTPKPKIHADAEAAGLKESIPQGPAYGNLPTDQHIALQTYKTGSPSDAGPWRALIALKELAKGLFSPKKPQEVN